MKEGEADVDQCPRCDEQMKLQRSRQKEDEYDCDVCRRRLRNFQYLLLCASCDYASCEKCCIQAAKSDEQFKLLLSRHGFGEQSERARKIFEEKPHNPSS